MALGLMVLQWLMLLWSSMRRSPEHDGSLLAATQLMVCELLAKNWVNTIGFEVLN